MYDVIGWARAPKMTIFSHFLTYYQAKIATMGPLVLIFVTFE